MKTALDLYDINGQVISKVDVPAAFNVKVDPKLIALAIRVYLANQRQATSKVKTRGEVNKTTKKIWRQKGTGRARHGSKAAPIFVGGGIAHGPSGEQEYSLKLPKKMRRQAILAAIAQAIIDNKLIVVDGLDKIATNTKSVAKLINDLKLDNSKSLCLLDQPLKEFIRSAQNIPHFKVGQAKRTNTFEIMAAEKVLVHKPALAILAETFGQPTKPQTVSAKTKHSPKVD